MNRRVVITGLGPVTPIGIGVSDFWTALLEGRSGVRRVRAFDPSRFQSQIAGEIDSLPVNDCIPKHYRKSVKIMARDIVLAVVAAYEAVRDANLRTRCRVERDEGEGAYPLDSTRFGANIGAGLICADLPELAEAFFNGSVNNDFSLARWGAEGMNTLTPLWLLKFLPNMLACHVTIVHDAQGPSNTITCAEASSYLAIGEAFRTISRGVADVCICGGAESKDNMMALLRQSLGKRLSFANDTPQRACRPFSATRDGMVVSEGGGLVILEALEHARKRGARIYAEIVGFGASNDAWQPGQPNTPPADGRGCVLAARKALRDAGETPESVDMVTSFACGLPIHDAMEATAIRTVLGERAEQVPILNVKGGLGNNGAGSGAIDFIATALAMYNSTIPPAINSGDVDPRFRLKLVSDRPVDARIDVALGLSYSLGCGQNAALVLRRWREP